MSLRIVCAVCSVNRSVLYSRVSDSSPVGSFLGDEHQVELGCAVAGGQVGQAGLAQDLFGGGGVLEGEHHLEERVAGAVAVGDEVLCESFEGHVLVGQSFLGGAADLVEEGVEGVGGWSRGCAGAGC